jgi:hypothetical protein
MPDVIIHYATTGEANAARAAAAQVRYAQEMAKGFGDATAAATKTDHASGKMNAAMHAGLHRTGHLLKEVALGIIGGGGIMSAYEKWKEVNKQVIEQMHELNIHHGGMERQFGTQTGLRGQALHEATAQVMEAGIKRSVTPENAFAVATQMSREQGGGAVNEHQLDAMMRVYNLANVAKGGTLNAAETTGTLMDFLENTGTEATPENIRKVGGSVARSDMGFEGLKGLAAHGAIMREAGIPIQEQLAAGEVTAGSEHDASALAKMALALTKKPEKGQKHALAALGLKSEDVDFVGENSADVLDRLAAAKDKLGEGQALPTFVELFGKKQAEGALLLVQQHEKFRKLKEKLDPASNEDAFNNAESGDQAVMRRQDGMLAETRRKKHQGEVDPVLLRRQLQIKALDKGESELAVGARLTAFDQHIEHGMDPMAAADFDFAGIAPKGMSGSRMGVTGLSAAGQAGQGPAFLDKDNKFAGKGRGTIEAAIREAQRQVDKPINWRGGWTPSQHESAKHDLIEAKLALSALEKGHQEMVGALREHGAKLEANTAATNANTAATGGGGGREAPPPQPASHALAH